MTDYPQLKTDELSHQVVIHTNLGDISLVLFRDLAPKTVKNFLELSQKGYYNGVIFHRVIPNFMIQGGDPSGTGMGGESIYGAKFDDEFSDQVFNLRGALSMANAGPNTNASQFFIVSAKEVPSQMLGQMKDLGYPAEIVSAYQSQGGTPWLDQRHTVFGQVLQGMDVVEAIEAVERNSQDRPLEDVVIQSVEVLV